MHSTCLGLDREFGLVWRAHVPSPSAIEPNCAGRLLKHKSVSVPPYDEHVPYITSEPDVRVHQLQDGDSFFIMGDYTHP